MAKRKRVDEFMLLAPNEEVRGHGGSYIVERVVGAGAFGAVYYSKDPTKPGRIVALKEFFGARHPREQVMLKDLFDRERVVGVLASPHPLMPTFYEAFTFDQHYYIAQEFIEGVTLDEIIRKRSPLPREWTVKWAVCLCDALAFLHSRGIVHHDLKPANIRISPQGHLTLLDFGAAQYFGKGHENEKPSEIYGTEGYLPPELDGDGSWVADVRTDIFALGCVLYEMIAGTPPDQELINQRSMTVTNFLMEMQNADLGLVALINRALSYNTDYRFANTNEFLMEIRKVAPPILLVSKKHMRFGDLQMGQHVAPIPVTLYNAGGGELQGEVKPRVPWIQVPSTSFKGNKRDVNVIINLAKVPERGSLITGKLEVNSRDILDMDGNIESSGDRWFIECSVRVLSRPGYIQVVERAKPEMPPLSFTIRKGQSALCNFTISNIGEKDVEYKIDAAPEPDSPVIIESITPSNGLLGETQSAAVIVQIPTGNLNPGTFKTSVVVRTTVNQSLKVPLVIVVQSPLDFFKSKIKTNRISSK